jgi:hypothetical protein
MYPLLCIAAVAACDDNKHPLNGSITSALKPGMTEQQVAEVSNNRVPDRVVMTTCGTETPKPFACKVRGTTGRSVRPETLGRFGGCQRTMESKPVALTVSRLSLAWTLWLFLCRWNAALCSRLSRRLCSRSSFMPLGIGENLLPG